MNTNIEISRFEGARQRVGKACLSSCRKLVAQMRRAKDAIRAEFNGTFQAQEHLLRLALNEAEALAWQTDFPQLVFPDLAMEKAQEVAAWQAKQRQLI
jgi:hypothetical protein